MKLLHSLYFEIYLLVFSAFYRISSHLFLVIWLAALYCIGELSFVACEPSM